MICLSHSLTTLFVSVLLVCCCDAASAVGGSGSSSCAAAELSPPLDGLYKQSKSLKFLLDGWRRVTDAFMGSVCVAASVQLKFASLSEDDVLVDPQRKLPALSFWLNKNNYNSQQAQLWCLTRM